MLEQRWRGLCAIVERRADSAARYSPDALDGNGWNGAERREMLHQPESAEQHQQADSRLLAPRIARRAHSSSSGRGEPDCRFRVARTLGKARVRGAVDGCQASCPDRGGLVRLAEEKSRR